MPPPKVSSGGGNDNLQAILAAQDQEAASLQPMNKSAPLSLDSGNMGVDLNPIKLSEEEIKDWFKRIERSKERRKSREGKWDILLDAYTPKINKEGEAADIKVPIQFRNVHTKIGQLFVKRPEVRLTPKGPMLDIVMIPDPAQPSGMRPASPEEIVPIRAAVLNDFMGRGADKINGTRLMDECLIDILAWAGIAAVKVGYKATIKPIQKPKMAPAQMVQGPDPMQPPQPGPAQPEMDPMTGQPVMEMVPVPVHKKISADRFSPKKLLLDDELTSTRYAEKSRWIGHEFFMNKRAAMRDLQLTEEDVKAVAEDDRVYKHDGDDAKNGDKDLVHGYEIFYYAQYFTDEIHPLAVYQLTLIEGLKDRSAVSRPSPDQSFDAEGKITADSMLGLPIKVGSNRDYPDSPYPWADTAFVHTAVRELSVFRQQGIKLRDAAIGKYLADSGAFEAEDLKKLQTGAPGETVLVKEGSLINGADKIWTTTAQVHGTADDYRTSMTLKQDVDETMGIGANDAGVLASTVRSATETSRTAATSEGRMSKEQDRILEFYLEIVEAVDSLIVRYMDQGDYVSLVGQDGTRRLVQWNNLMIAGRHSYDIEPDSQMSLDGARNGQQDMQFYNLVAPDPLVNRVPILRKMALRRGYDPFAMIADPATQAVQPAHGGGPANKHEAENTGEKPNAPGASNRDERAAKPPTGGQ